MECVSEGPGPETAVHADRSAGPAGLIQVVDASGALLVAMVRTTRSGVRAYHSDGVTDPGGFAAMGVVEILVHTHDLARGLDLSWDPPAVLRGTCAAVSRRAGHHGPLAHPAVGRRTRRTARAPATARWKWYPTPGS